MKILFFGDVFGKPGREALRHAIPQWKKEFEPNVIIANGENVSHGAGISDATIKHLLASGVHIITGGNHSFEGKNASILLNDASLPLLRPANMPSALPGRGYAFFGIKGNELRITNKPDDADLLVINLIGQVHMRYQYDSPFRVVDEILSRFSPSATHPPFPVIVDWHAEATSEKIAMGWHLDGRVAAVLGTHSHTPTADERILPKGTAYISDIGMVGPHYSIIGQEISANLERFLTQIPKKVDVAQAPPYEINAVLLETDPRSHKVVQLRRLRNIISDNLSHDN